MIKALAHDDNEKPIYILGLSDDNLARLRAGQPIKFSMSELGAEGTMLIFAGRTEESMADTRASAQPPVSQGAGTLRERARVLVSLLGSWRMSGSTFDERTDETEKVLTEVDRSAEARGRASALPAGVFVVLGGGLIMAVHEDEDSARADCARRAPTRHCKVERWTVLRALPTVPGGDGS